MYLESLCVVLEAQGEHSIQDVLSTNRLPLLHLALLCGLRRNEADKLRNTFLHAFLRLLRDLGRTRH